MACDQIARFGDALAGEEESWRARDERKPQRG